jgi:protein TonB
MSAILQVRARESEAITTAENATPAAVVVPGRDNPLQLLREAITRLNSSNGEFPDQTQMADLLAEVQEALERAGVIGRVVAQCEEFAAEAQFEKGFRALDAGLLASPGDPALIARRCDLVERQRAFQSAATVRTALEEAHWLLNQDRLDLAANFLKEKAADLPDQPALISRLEEIEALLPQWEQDRHVQAALGRVAALEELQQCQMALTIVEEALQSYSASAELTDAARRVRDRLANQERQTRLARRVELIGQKIGAQCWTQALPFLENTEKEFPGAPELKPLRREVAAGFRRSACDALVTEVRQCVTDGEPEQAEQILRRGMESLGHEPALEGLREELESERKYREELRAAQVLFGRRQLPEAERVLAGLVAQNRMEAQALLDAVRQARAVSEEEDFCERGREKALRLMQQGQFAQAADLLRNLGLLFPGNPILQRDLLAVQGALDQGSQEVNGAAGEKSEEENREPQTPGISAPAPPFSAQRAQAGTGDGVTARKSPSPRVRRAAIIGTASLMLVSAGGAAWKFAHDGALVSPQSAAPSATPPMTQIPAATPPPVTSAGGYPDARLPIETAKKPSPLPPVLQPTAHQRPATIGTAPAKGSTQQPAAPAARVLRPFLPPATKQTPVEVQSPLLSLPQESEAIISAETIASLPAELVEPVNPPAPQSVVPVPSPAPRPTLAAGGRGQEAQLISRTLPVYPQVARQRGLFGVVRMEAVIDEYGAIRNVKVVSGDPNLAVAARNAVMTWKYKPATLNGHPVTSTATIQVSFEDHAKK